ncbi:MAG: hypothetical protein ABSH34_09845 [Verrucomicrobiota bacterium]|jgi:hypothetical protein
MILNTHRNTSPRLAKARLGFITSAAALIAVLAVCSGPRLVLAQSQPPTPATATSASGPPASVPPGDVEPGPKLKPGEAPVTPPQGAAIEERLARLEQMVQKLLAQPGPRRPRKDAQELAPEEPLARKGKDLKDWKNQLFDPEEMELLQERVKRDVAAALDQALREAARATEQVKRAYEQAQRAAKEAASNYLRAEQNQDAQDHDPAQNSVNQQLEALQSQRAALERELQKLVRQIRRLKKDQQPSAEAPQRRDQTGAVQPKPEPAPSELPAAK